jgi:hypothetical protein
MTVGWFQNFPRRSFLITIEHMAVYRTVRSIAPVMANVHATGLWAALRRRNLGAELLLLAECRLSQSGHLPSVSGKANCQSHRAQISRAKG